MPMENQLYIFDENFARRGALKSFVKKLIGRSRGGLGAMEQSLILGLRELKAPFVLNKPLNQPIDIACVISGAATLKAIIKKKQAGLVKKIVAGPGIVSYPLQHHGLIFRPEIDIYLVPSSWVGEFCDFFHPGFKQKIRLWAAGVETLDDKIPVNGRAGCLVYKKNSDNKTFSAVLAELAARKIPYSVVEYGKYKRADYLKQLAKTRFMVFLSASESQGLALHEAWMLNVPTLVWNGGHLKTKNYEWQTSSPAPYLTARAGIFFSGAEDFGGRLEEFLRQINSFSPRQYHLQNFTNALAAQNFLALIKD